MSPPAVSPLLLRLFARYSRGYLARHFHGVRLSRANVQIKNLAQEVAILRAQVRGLEPGAGDPGPSPER